jgi:hypothetical protein
MSIKVIFIITFLICVGAIDISAQTMEVPTVLLDKANQAFVEVDALRKDVEALKADGKAKDEVIAAQQDEILSRDVLLMEKNALIFLKDSLIESQNKTIQRLEERDAIRIAEITALRKLKCDKDVWLGGIYKKIRCR